MFRRTEKTSFQFGKGCRRALVVLAIAVPIIMCIMALALGPTVVGWAEDLGLIVIGPQPTCGSCDEDILVLP